MTVRGIVTGMLLIVAAASASAAAAVRSQLAEAVDAAVNAEMVRQGLIGVGAGVAFSATGERYVNGYGLASLERGTPVVANETLFRYASISKTVAAVTAADLILAGAIDLDADVRQYAPFYPTPTQYYVCADGGSICGPEQLVPREIPADRRKVTMRQIFTHRSGIQHYSNSKFDPTPPEELCNDPVVNTGMRWALDYWIAEPLIDIPDSAYHYSSFAFNLAGVVIETVANTSFAELLAARVTSPLKLASMRPDYEWEAVPERADGYNALDRNVGSADVSFKAAGGGLMSTPDDLLGYCEGLMGDQLLSPAAKELLWGAPTPDGVGLAFFVQTDASGRVLSVDHNGSTQKAATRLIYYVQEGLCVVVMSNSEQADVTALERAIAQAARSA